MTLNPVRIGSLRTAMCLCFLAALLLGHAQAQSQTIAKGDMNPKTWPYNERVFARSLGNIGGWWSFMSENDKAAFLDGFKSAMDQAHQHEQNVCEVMRQDISKDPNIPIKAMSEIAFMCSEVSDTADYDKVTVKDVDEFYSDPVNQPMVLEWVMGYLRDKASGRKTEGQLLDALKAEQKDVHDCSKYPNLCKLGVKESSQPSQ